MFQPWFVELVSVLNSIVGAVIGIALLGLAVYGYNQWRTEVRGQAQFKLASKMVKLASQFKDEFERARFFITTKDERAKRAKSVDEMPEQTRILDERDARVNRMGVSYKIFGKLEEAVWEADVILGEEASKLIQPLRREWMNLFDAAFYYFEEELRNLREPNTRTPKIEARQKELWNIIYNTRFGEDEVARRVENTVNNLKEYLKKFLKE